MNEGKIEQVGSPFEVKNFPKTAFAANFVGTLNTASAEVLDLVLVFEDNCLSFICRGMHRASEFFSKTSAISAVYFFEDRVHHLQIIGFPHF